MQFFTNFSLWTVCDSNVCVYDPIDCGDNNVCTIDTCSGGTCSNTPVNCDDGNRWVVLTSLLFIPRASLWKQGHFPRSSTYNWFVSSLIFYFHHINSCTQDTCDSVLGCQHTPIAGCCGNGICEPNAAVPEDNSSCPLDCTCPLGQKYISVDVKTDNYPTETSWTVVDAATSNTVLSGSGYATANTLYSDSVCVAPAEYAFTINDTYGGTFPLSC